MTRRQPQTALANSTRIEQFIVAPSLYKAIVGRAKEQPYAIAIRLIGETTSRAVTYEDLLAITERCRTRLEQLELGTLSRVMIISPNSAEVIATILAVQEMTAAPVMVDPNLAVKDISTIIGNLEPACIVTTKRLFDEKLGALSDGQCFLDIEQELAPLNEAKVRHGTGENIEVAPGGPTNNHDTALIIMTSGTTGYYKGVMLSRTNVMSAINSGYSVFRGIVGKEIQEQQRFLCLLPLYHGMPLILVCFTAFCFGYEVSFTEGLEIDLIRRALQESKPTAMPCVPRLVERFAASIEMQIRQRRVTKLLVEGMAAINKISLKLFGRNLGKLFFQKIHQQFGGCLQAVVCGGAPLDSRIIRRMSHLGFEIYNAYGLTESTNASTCNLRSKSAKGSVGVLFPEHELKLVNCSDDGEGEIAIRGPMLMQGYYKDSAATQASLKEGWLHTGDLGRVTGDFLFITGRLKEIIVTPEGETLIPDLLQAHFENLSRVSEFAVIGMPHRENNGEEIHAVVVIDPKTISQRSTIADVQRKIVNEIRRVGSTLPSYSQIKQVHFMDAIPRTALLKVKRHELRSLLLKSLSGKSKEEELYEQPGDSLEHQIAAIWKQLFGTSRLIGRRSDFFSLGGDSLLASQMVAQLRRDLKVEILLRDIFEYPILFEFAAQIRSAMTQPRGARFDSKRAKELNYFVGFDPRLTIPCDYPEAPPQHLFLTGGTGFLGAFLIRDLLKRLPHTTLSILVRAKSQEEGLYRLSANAHKYSFSIEESKGCIRPVLGDLTQPRLGIGEEEYKRLADKVDLIIHNGALVNFVHSYEKLAPTNVGGTRAILDLSISRKPKPIHYVSTVAVFPLAPDNKARIASEYEDLVTDGEIIGGYAQTKWVAEMLMQSALKQGLRITIYRPGAISGSSKDGACELAEFSNSMIKGCICLGAAPDLAVRTELIPVDFVSDFIASAIAKGVTQQIFNVTHPQATLINELAQTLRGLGYELEVMHYDRWNQRLRAAMSSDPSNPLLPFLHLLPEMESDASWLTKRPIYCCDEMLSFLKGEGAPPPAKVDCLLIQRYVNYLQSRDFLSPAGSYCAPPEVGKSGHVEGGMILRPY